ncbi:MAG: hypothetical protein RLY31_1121 [Bacteroidota bacterium]|jgi:epoxyqueuosine reductase
MIGDKERIRQEAARLGFAFTGFARAVPLSTEARRLEEWLRLGYHGQMAYMERHFDLRIDPTRLVPGARTVIVLLHNYFPRRTQSDPTAPKLARYAYGADYHRVLKRKLRRLLSFIHENIGAVNGRCFTDSAPVMERDWARYAGLGWTGKNTLLIHPRAGSYHFLATLIVDLPLPPDEPLRDHCGTCRRCITACPTQAISPQGYLLDASRCISYLTIELRTDIPDHFRGLLADNAFGCDICQEVCPWNRFSSPQQEPAFEPAPELLDLTRAGWMDMTEAVFDRLFAHSAVRRAGFKGLSRNLAFLRNTSHPSANKPS